MLTWLYNEAREERGVGCECKGVMMKTDHRCKLHSTDVRMLGDKRQRGKLQFL